MEIKVYSKNGREDLANIVNTHKISTIEFELNLQERDTDTEIIEYVKELCEKQFLITDFVKATRYSNDLLIELGNMNKHFLRITY